VFLDPLSGTGDDLGLRDAWLWAGHVHRDDAIRMIAARLAARAERTLYEES
jgi:uncharacterized DUF497 family protein